MFLHQILTKVCYVQRIFTRSFVDTIDRTKFIECYEGVFKVNRTLQCLSQDFETGCLKLAVVKFWGVQIFKGDHNVLIFQP